MSVISTKKPNESLVRKYLSVIFGHVRPESFMSVNPCVTFLRIYFENLTVITCMISGVNFKKELPNLGIIKASKCKTCEVEDGSIRTDPETGEEKKVKLERCAKCRMVWYCGKECQQQNWPYHKPNCNKSTVGVGLPVFIKMRKVTDRETLVNTIKNASRFTIDYKWDDDSISNNKESHPDPEPFEIDPFNMVSSIEHLEHSDFLLDFKILGDNTSMTNVGFCIVNTLTGLVMRLSLNIQSIQY